MKKNINKVKCDIQSHIVAAGYTQKEAVDACSAEYGWSDSDSNFSNKLDKETIRYKEVLELADVLGYDIVWQKRRDCLRKIARTLYVTNIVLPFQCGTDIR